MLDLSGFKKLGSRAGRRMGDCMRRSDGRVRLYLSASTAGEATSYFGYNVGVFIDAESGRVVLTRGNDRRIAANGAASKNASRYVSLGGDAELVKRFGAFLTMGMKPSWESTPDHQKVLLFTPTGEVELESDMTVRRLK